MSAVVEIVECPNAFETLLKSTQTSGAVEAP
jgi:hypothetical protein